MVRTRAFQACNRGSTPRGVTIKSAPCERILCYHLCILSPMPKVISNLRVFVFPGQFGLPTLGPFALKLEAWLRVMSIEYTQVVEPNPAKGPKGKNPWIEYGDVRMGDTELIIAHLEGVLGRRMDDWHSLEEAAVALATRRMIEEHLHQVFEYELMIMDEGWQYIVPGFNIVPFPLRNFVSQHFRKKFRKQLFARGILRHTPDIITAKGRADLDALSQILGDKPWLLGDKPSTVDMSMYGMVAPMIFSPIQTPVMQHARSVKNIVEFCERVRATYFSDER